jgi:hypothetical protein
MHGEMTGGRGMGGHMGGMGGGYRDMLLKRAWEYLDEDQTRQMILRMIDKKILYIESRMQLGQQKLETLKMMREMIAASGTGAGRTAEQGE